MPYCLCFLCIAGSREYTGNNVQKLFTVSTTLQRHIKRLEIARNNGVELKYEKI